MENRVLVTGSIFNKGVRFLLLLVLGGILGSVTLQIGGKKVAGEVRDTKPVVVSAVSVVTPETIAESVPEGEQYLVLGRTNGEYAFAKLKNASIENDKFVGTTEFEYQNGESKLVEEVGESLTIHDDQGKEIETDKVVLRGVRGLVLIDGSMLPVKIVNGRVSGGKLIGKAELWSLKDNARIFGEFDARGNIQDISVQSSVADVDTAQSAVGKEVLGWLEKTDGEVQVILPGQEEAEKTLGEVTGAVKIDPLTGLAILNSGVVGDAQIVNGSITTLKIADGAVTAVKIGSGAVTTAKLFDSAVTEAKITDGAVTNGKLSQITDANKVAGSAVQLKGGGGITNDSGLSLSTSCSLDQVLSWDGDSWECESVSGVGTGISSINNLAGGLTIAGGGINTVTAAGTTITVTGTLPSVGTAGSYGSATEIPVLTTDANGRVSGVTNTAISGLTTANLSASAGITNAQLSNNSIYVSPGSGIAISGSPVSLGGTVTISGVDASTAVKGVASFNPTNFSASAGIINTVQDIDNSANPLFNSLSLAKTTGQLVLGTTNTITISALASTSARTATVPALSSNDTFVLVNQSQTLSNKTLTAGQNTISGLTNTNLSGSAGITDANLATITTSSKVSGSAVQLATGGGLTNNTGLSLLTSCSANEVLKWIGSAWVCSSDSTGGTPSVYSDGGLYSDGTGLSMLRTCSNGQILKWQGVGTGWVCSADDLGGGGTLTVQESDFDPSHTGITTMQFGPTTTSSDEFSVSSPSASTVRVRLGTNVVLGNNSISLTNKTIDASLNTLSNIADSSLSTISTSGKVAGSAVQLATGGGLTNNTGLSLLTSCSSGEVLSWSGSAWVCTAITASTTLNSIAAATGANTIANADYAQVWNFALTTASKTGLTLGESAASTNGSGSQYIMNVRTVSASTAAPLGVFARGLPIIDTAAAGGVTIGNATLAQAITIDSGAGAINLGNSATGKTITIGSTTGTGALNMYAGTGNVVIDGAGATTYTIGSGATSGTFSIGGTAQTGTANLFAGTGAMTLNIGTGAAAKTITLGNTNSTTATSINAGTGGITLLTASSGNLSLTTGSTGTVTLDSGTTGTINIGTNANAKTINLGTGSGVAETINIGGTGANTVALGNVQSGGLVSLGNAMTTGTITIGGTAQTGTITLGSSSGTNILNIANGTGATTLNLANAQTAGAVNIGAGMTTGTITIGGTGLQTGAISIGTGTGAQSLNFGTGSGAKTVTVGSTNTTSSLNLVSGTGGINVGSDAVAKSINIGTGAAAQTVTVGSANTTSTLNLAAGTGGIYFTNGLAAQTNGNVTVCVNSTTKQLYYGLTSSCNTSSEVYKHDIVDLSSGLAMVNALRPVSFVYNDGDVPALGFIAEEVYGVDDRPVERDVNGKIIGLNYDELVPIIARGVQELDVKVETNKAETTKKLSEMAEDRSLVGVVMEEVKKYLSGVWRGTVEFFGEVIFRADTYFAGRPIFNRDTAGFAIIKAGGNEVEVIFGREYEREPVVNISLNITGGANLADVGSYAVADVSRSGFKIRLAKVTGMDLRFSWTAMAVKDVRSVMGSTTTVQPTETVAEPTGAVVPETTLVPSSTPTPGMEIEPEMIVNEATESSEPKPAMPEPEASDSGSVVDRGTEGI